MPPRSLRQSLKLTQCGIIFSVLMMLTIALFVLGRRSAPVEVEETAPPFQSHRQLEKKFMELLGANSQTDRVILEDSPTYKDLKNAILNELKGVVNSSKKQDDFSQSTIDYNSLKELIINDIRSIVAPDWEQISRNREKMFEQKDDQSSNHIGKILNADFVEFSYPLEEENDMEIDPLEKLEKITERQSEWIAMVKGYLFSLKDAKNAKAGTPDIRRITVLEQRIERFFWLARIQSELIEKLKVDVAYAERQLESVRQYFSQPSLELRGPTKAQVPTAKRKLIFSLNAGRSGSGYLAKLLETSPNVLSFHERPPRMSGPPLRLAKEYGLNLTRNDRFAKAYAIERDLNANPGKIYVETSHLFISAFYDVILEYFPKEHFDIRVVALRRHFSDVFQFVNSSFDTTQTNWYYGLSDKIATLPFLATKDTRNLALEYLIDVEAKIQWFKSAYPHIQVVDARWEELHDIEGVEKLFNALEIDITDKTRDYLQSLDSVRLDRLETVETDTAVAGLMVAFYNRYETAGKKSLLPDLPNLQPIKNKLGQFLRYVDDGEEVNAVQNPDEFFAFLLRK